MPDWTYQTVLRPILFRLKAETARSIALGAMGRLSRLPLGKQVIQWMGHTKVDSRLAIERNGFLFSSSVGLSCNLDPMMLATPAFTQFGLSFLEIGPITTNPVENTGAIELDVENESIRFQDPWSTMSPQTACDKLKQDGPYSLPVFARVEPSSPEEAQQIVDMLGPCVDAFVVTLERLSTWIDLTEVENSVTKPAPVLVAVDAKHWQNESQRKSCVESFRNGLICGLVVVESVEEDGSMSIGKSGREEALETVRQIRTELGAEPLVIGAVGVHSPADFFDYLEVGADLVQVDSGMVFAGPSLPKRINEAQLYRHLNTQPESKSPVDHVGGQAWLWAWLMGLSMFIGGVIAMVVATTRVVLPYDESMSGLSRDQLAGINDRLLSFMTHDRVTLAGTMLAVGIIYLILAWWGIRRGVHWAYVTVIASAMAGFLSFFSFLSFGYFDSFHAFVTAILFQFLLMMIHSQLPLRTEMEMPDLRNDRRWLANQWGQLLFVIHGAVLIVAGAVISYVGMTSVFVAEDLEFMNTSIEELCGANPQLLPLVAHDRATFGGMLIACGVATLLPALWGFRRGQAWLWWALMLGGNLAYVSAILVHWSVGYYSMTHLLPAYGGFAWLWVGGIASYWFLVARDPELEEEWARRLN